MWPRTKETFLGFTNRKKGKIMKNITSKLIALGLTGALAVGSFTACSKAKETTAGTTGDTAVETIKGDKKAGGWSISQDTKITDAKLKIFNKAIEGLTGVSYEPVAYLGSQVVAGTNHCFLCKSTVIYPGATNRYTLVYIYERFDGTEEILSFEDVTLPGTADAEGNPIAGGWSYAEDPAVDAKITEVVDKATEKLLGVEYEPVANIGSQVVAGTNHAVLCRITAVTPDAPSYYALVYIYEDLEGNCEVTEITDIELSAG